MIYFKRELLNREENFNKKFESGGSRGMNVGVMQVLKTNNPKQPPGKPGQRPRRQSSMGPASQVPQRQQSQAGPMFGAGGVNGNQSGASLGVGRM